MLLEMNSFEFPQLGNLLTHVRYSWPCFSGAVCDVRNGVWNIIPGEIRTDVAEFELKANVLTSQCRSKVTKNPRSQESRLK